MKHKLFHKEIESFKDIKTKNTIFQLTNSKSINHHPFFHVNAYDKDQSKIYFISHRTGKPQVMFIDLKSYNIFQLTDFEEINEWSINPSFDGNYIYFTSGHSGWRVEVETGLEEKIIDFNAYKIKEDGMVAAAMGTTCLSNCGEWWGVTYKNLDNSIFMMINTSNGKSNIILERESISHMQFCPDDSNYIFYAGPLTDRVWMIKRDGSENKRIYAKKPDEWITHESWVPKTMEIAFVDWPKGMRSISVIDGTERKLADFNAWHAISNLQGTRFIADTNYPDIGLQIFNHDKMDNKPETICFPEASSVGEHWNGPFPYGKGPIKVYAPQNTHPHPRFSPDGKKIIYTSDKTKFSQIYQALVPENHWPVN
tara:strand:- start:930 stop:2033 length:1104 start_codon:yes stop_codon:yes gene_type:complete